MDNKNNIVVGKNENTDEIAHTIDTLITNKPIEVTELKNKRVDFEYPDEPVGIKLANKYFEIASFIDENTNQAEYYLIDPNQLNNEDGITSYKMIDANVPLQIGKDSSHGFNLPNTVSRNHATIARITDNSGDRISIEDLGSTNGTTLFLPRKDTAPDRLEVKEVVDNKTTADFKKFTAKYQSYMDEAYNQKNRKQVAKIIYNGFYSLDETDIENFDLNEDEVARLNQELYSKQKSLYSENIHNHLAPGNINTQASDAWYFYTQGSIRPTPELGRIYINVKLDKAVDFMRDLLISIGNDYQEIDTQIKIPKQASKHNICRKDKMVMYFYNKDQKAVLECIEKIYHLHKDHLNKNGTPRFTESLLDSTGIKMDGIGFGQEPYDQNDSFGAVRSNILADVFWDAKGMGHQVSDGSFDFDNCYIDACHRHNVDPNNPAFNLNDNRFQEIKKRLSLKKAAA